MQLKENIMGYAISMITTIYKNKRNDYSERKFYYEFNMQKKNINNNI